MKLTQGKVEFICDKDIPEEEAKKYISRGLIMHPTLVCVQATVHDDGYIDLVYKFETPSPPYERIKRI